MHPLNPLVMANSPPSFFCRHALVGAGRVHSVLATDEISERSSAFEAQGVTTGTLTMCHRCCSLVTC